METNKLKIKDVELSDGGTYKCRGINKKRFYVMYVTCKCYFLVVFYPDFIARAAFNIINADL